MSVQAKPAVTLGLIVLSPLQDVQKTYSVCLEIAKQHENEVTFQGIWTWSLVNPNRDVQMLSFIADADLINSIVEEVKSKLNIDNVLFQINPFIRPLTVKPPSDMST